MAHAIASLIRPISFSSDALRFCAILIERKENGQFKPSRRLHEAKQSAVRRGRAIISLSIAVAYLHLYTQYCISFPAKRQAFFPSGERFPRFYSNRGFQAKGLVNYHEKKYPDLEILSKYPSFFSSFQTAVVPMRNDDTGQAAKSAEMFPFSIPLLYFRKKPGICCRKRHKLCLRKEKADFPRKPVSFPKTTIRREFK